MKKLSSLFCFVALFGLFSLVNADMQDPDSDDYALGRVIVDIKHEYLPITPTPNGEGIIETGHLSIDSLNTFYQVYSFEKIYKGQWEAVQGYFLLKFPDTFDVNQVVSSYSNDPHVLCASPDFKIEFDVTPVDSFYPQQWGLHKIKCPDAWRHTNGSPYVVIEIIDNCIDYGHPDLVHNMWQNLGQWPDGEDMDGDGHTIEWDPVENEWVLDPGDLNDDDDDFNGYPDDLVGWNFEGNYPEYEPNPNTACVGFSPWDVSDHGDHTAGTAAAVTNNYITPEEATKVCDNWTGTVAGTAWFCKIMAARVSDHYNQRIAAIAYGVDNGAKIISMSWSFPFDPPGLEDIINSAWDEGLLLVASAGNQSSETPRYPAFYENVIAVAGTDNNDVKEENSNYGTWVDICAPWDNWSPGREHKWWRYCYSEIGGTSISAPFVSGVAALVWSCNRWATNAEVREALETTADNIDAHNPGYQGLLGSGRVNALEAVKIFRPVPPAPGDCNADGVIDLGDILWLSAYLYRNGLPPDPLCVGDVNDDGIIDLEDMMYLVNYLYKGGSAPLDGCD